MNQLILFIVGQLLVLNGDYTESMIEEPEYNCEAAEYETNPLNEFVEHCAPDDWRSFFGRPEIKRDLDELTPFILEEAIRLEEEAKEILKEAKEKNKEPPKFLPGIEPPMRLMFEALNRVALKDIKVVIIGQDPTPQPGKATGLAFSVDDPKSVGTVLNVLLEVAFEGFPVDLHKADVSSWADQGVLLLNSALTVTRGEPGSHLEANWWDYFTEKLVQYISEYAHSSVWLLWGRKAQHFEKFIKKDEHLHYVITGGHPSSRAGVRSRNNFFGKGYFQCANKFLDKVGGPHYQIKWGLPPSNNGHPQAVNVLDQCPIQESVGM